MSKLSPSPAIAGAAPTPAEALAQLRAILALVTELGGVEPGLSPHADDIGRRYDRASPVAQARFDSLAGETAAYAAAGLAALIAGRGHGAAANGGAAHLAREMERSIRRMEALLA